ncbi:hypothetical protein SARC_03755 [Sphaeroforma arctica JP610]|uniref:DOMON domain-containing protein n=1 Tax=Sphaeroforma arctica JP610 TaxID=667725 RepID=A0A0L0G5C7_9EUKA|nr:hypothetical protein SARC_03755 [Sphaeroforma arctica JP610]KNC84021.1 hypothetical protein SARC_03755 [Sphaeroforma arctica JP610]|eukprot:XP_014157923.1 hypothetical protein SARC_03755 [Sphaeroforma arctica JP610]
MKLSTVLFPVALLCTSLSVAAAASANTAEEEETSDGGFFSGIKNTFNSVKDAFTSGVDKIKHIGDKTFVLNNTKDTEAWVAIAYKHTGSEQTEDLTSVAWMEVKPNTAKDIYTSKDTDTFYIYISDKKGVEGLQLFNSAGTPAGFCVSNDDHTIQVKDSEYEVWNTSGLTMPFQSKQDSCFEAGGAVKSFQPVTYTDELTIVY